MIYAQEILAHAPTLYFEHEEDSGLVMTDGSGNGTDGTYPASGITFDQPGPLVGQKSAGILLDGVTGRGLVGTLTGSNKPDFPFTLELWVDPRTVAVDDPLLMLVNTSQTQIAAIKIGAGGTTWRAIVGDQFDTRTVDGGALSGGLQHVAARFVSTTERYLVVDGIQVASNTQSLTWSAIDNFTLSIGRGPTTGAINATLSRSAFYNTDVSTARLLAHWRAGVISRIYHGLSAKLKADATVLAQTAGRIFAEQFPDDGQLPGIRYTIQARSPHDRLASGDHFTARIQVDAYAQRTDDGIAWTISDAARQALNRQTLAVTGFAPVAVVCTDRGTQTREGSFTRIRTQYRLQGNAA